MDGETCSTCRFFSIAAGRADAESPGYCRRNPPVLLPQSVLAHAANPLDGRIDKEDAADIEQGDAGVWGQPFVFAAGWCGEHKPKRVPLPVAGDKSLPLKEWTPVMLADELVILVQKGSWMTATTFARVLFDAASKLARKPKGDA